MALAEIEKLQDDFFGLRFAYDPALVSRVRALKNRRWNKEEKRWEVHIAHLGDVLKLFHIEPAAIDRKLMRSYQIHSIRNSCVKLEWGNVVAKISGADLPIDKIDEATSFYVPGYQYMPKFIEGQWDGRRHLFDRRVNSFPSGLGQRVRGILEAEKIGHELILPETPPPSALKMRQPAVELRDYQKECVLSAIEKRRGVLELATGAGKTTIATCIIHQLARPTLFIVHSRDLLHQTRKYMEDQLGLPIGCIGDGQIDIKPVTVATVQTCARALEITVGKTDEDESLETDKTDVKSRREEIVRFVRACPVVFFDECHHLPADCCYSLAMQTHAAYWRFGLSATPYRSDRMDLLLEAALGPVIYRANASVLIEKGFLVAPKVTFHSVPPMTITTKTPDYQSIFADYIVENGNRNRLIAEQARQLASKKKSVLILVSQVRHGNVLRELIPEAEFIQGSDTADKRADAFDRLGRKQLLIMIATTLADEGLDIPSLNAIILGSGGKSETRALQRVGRALRTSPRKKDAVIIDFLDDAPYLKEHSQRRFNLFSSEPAFQVVVKR